MISVIDWHKDTLFDYLYARIKTNLIDIYMKTRTFIIALLASMTVLPIAAKSVELSFNYQKQSGAGSNQWAVWIENSEGKVVMYADHMSPAMEAAVRTDAAEPAALRLDHIASAFPAAFTIMRNIKLLLRYRITPVIEKHKLHRLALIIHTGTKSLLRLHRLVWNIIFSA